MTEQLDYALPIYVALRAELCAHMTGETLVEMVERKMGSPSGSLADPKSWSWEISQRIPMRLSKSVVEKIVQQSDALGWTVPGYVASLLMEASDEALVTVKAKTPMKASLSAGPTP